MRLLVLGICCQGARAVPSAAARPATAISAKLTIPARVAVQRGPLRAIAGAG